MMNLLLNDSAGRRQRCRQWTPIITQQLRLRHLYQIIAYNLVNGNTTDGFHFTLHLTAMSAPFYTSKIVHNSNPKWGEIVVKDLHLLACTGFVLRIWQSSEICITWGIHLSGLVYMGNALSDIQPNLFLPNTVIFQMRGGFFTSCKHLKSDLPHPLPCIDSLNLLSTESETKVYKLAAIRMPVTEIRKSYSLAKLKQLQAIQISIRNRNLSVDAVCEEINARLNPVLPKNEPHEHSEANGSIRYEPQLLTMTHLNKMLQDKPRVQRSEIIKVQKELEVSRLKNKMLQQERDKKSAELRLCKEKFNIKCDENEEQSSQLMENYRQLSKEMEKLRDWKNDYIHQRELLHQQTKKLQCRRRQLMSELLQLYPITNIKDKYFINGIELPHANVLVDSAEMGVSVALGYCSHLLIMCATFLQIPLRYPIKHFGSQSCIEDHISPNSDKHKEFPLFSRGKDRLLFSNAVYLLNKNIAQYLHSLGFKPQVLHTTLPNILMLLQGKETRSVVGEMVSTAGSSPDEVHQMMHAESALRPFASHAHRGADPILDSIRQEAQMQRTQSPKRRRNKDAPKGGLTQILAIPEAVLSKQMSGSTFLTYMRGDLSLLDRPTTSAHCDTECATKAVSCDITKQASVEEGTEVVPNCSDDAPLPPAPATPHSAEELKEVEEEQPRAKIDSPVSEPLVNDVSLETNNSDQCDSPRKKAASSQYEIQKWLDSGPNLLVHADENLYPDEFLGRSVDPVNDGHGHLTLRTDALVQRKSFNLVKPKF